MKIKDDSSVRTSALEAVLVTLVCIITFLGLVYIWFMPYIGEHISEQQKEVSDMAEDENADVTLSGVSSEFR